LKWKSIYSGTTKLFDSHLQSPPFNGALRDLIVEAVSRIERIEAERGDIPRSARSALDPKAQPYQDLIDRLFYVMAGLSEAEASAIEDRLTRML